MCVCVCVCLCVCRRALSNLSHEERAKKENRILTEFRSMVHKKLSKAKN